MSGAVRSTMFKRALERWPKNPLRPDCQLQDVLAKRLEAGPLAPPHALKNGVSKAEAEMRQANAFYSLLENRYKSIYKLKGDIMRPRSNPTYYQDLITELDEAPTRSWLDRTLNKFKGMIRFTS